MNIVTNKIIIDSELLADIKNEVLASFEVDEIKNYKSFDDFFNDVDVQNSYEEEWTEENIEKYKPYYKIVYTDIKQDKLVRTYYIENSGDMSVGIAPFSGTVNISIDISMNDADYLKSLDDSMKLLCAELFELDTRCNVLTEDEYRIRERDIGNFLNDME